MQLDEQTRHEVFGTLRDKLGQTAAVVLMSAIPPFDWSEVATKSDLRDLEERLEERLTDRLSVRMYRAMLIQTFALFSANLALLQAMGR